MQMGKKWRKGVVGSMCRSSSRHDERQHTMVGGEEKHNFMERIRVLYDETSKMKVSLDLLMIYLYLGLQPIV